MPSKRPPRTNVIAVHPMKPHFEPRMARYTPYCMVNDDSTRRMVATRTGGTSSASPFGGQLWMAADRMLKYATNSPEKNISSDANQTMTPTCSSLGRYIDGSTCRSAGAGRAPVVEIAVIWALFLHNAALRTQTRATRAPGVTSGHGAHPRRLLHARPFRPPRPGAGRARRGVVRMVRRPLAAAGRGLAGRPAGVLRRRRRRLRGGRLLRSGRLRPEQFQRLRRPVRPGWPAGPGAAGVLRPRHAGAAE